MDTRLAVTFLAAARCGNFSQAATELHFAQSTVTAQIMAFEAELGAKLFDRHRSGAQLTDAGLRAVQLANDLLSAEAALRESAMPRGALRGTVTVGATESLCAYLLPKAIASLRKAHPDVIVNLLPVGSQEGRISLRTGTLQLLLMLEPPSPEVDIKTEVLRDVNLVYVRDREEGAPPPAEWSWAAVSGQRWFLLEEGCSHSDEVARLLLKASGHRCSITRLGSVDAVRACVAAGLGAAVLPDFAVDSHPERLFTTAIPNLTTSIQLAESSRHSPRMIVEAVATELRRA